MIEAMIDVRDSTLKTIQGLLRGLVEQGVVDALLVPAVPELPKARIERSRAPRLRRGMFVMDMNLGSVLDVC